MRKVKKIMNIEEKIIHPIEETCLSINICNIKHEPVHYHTSCIEMIMCLDGNVTILCNHEIVTLKKGELFTIGFEDLHCLYADADNLVLCFYIDTKQTHLPWKTLKYTYFACEDSSCEPYQRTHLQKIKNLLLASVYTYAKNHTLEKDMALRLSSMILDLLMKYFDWFNHINLSPNNNNELRQRFRTVMAYCVNHHTEKLTIPQITRAVHINENYFSQFIHKSGYGSFSNLIGYIRCYSAQYLLLTSELSVIQISDRCGFSDVKYFYKYFRQIWQKTPTEYRKWFIDYRKEKDDVSYFSAKEIFPQIEKLAAEYFSQMILSQI